MPRERWPAQGWAGQLAIPGRPPAVLRLSALHPHGSARGLEQWCPLGRGRGEGAPRLER